MAEYASWTATWREQHHRADGEGPRDVEIPERWTHAVAVDAGDPVAVTVCGRPVNGGRHGPDFAAVPFHDRCVPCADTLGLDRVPF